MNKWTLEKINDCEEIKFGTEACIGKNRRDRVVILKREKVIKTVNSIEEFTEWRDISVISAFQFYRPDGTEILPPEDSKTEEQIEAEFQEKSKELVKFLNDNCHPHTTIIITPVSAEMVELKTGFKCEDYLRD